MCTNQEIDTSGFTKVLGSGGFGLVLYNPSTNLVAKFIYKTSDCEQASIEAGYHRMVYDSFLEWKSVHSTDQINIVKPCGYRDAPIVWNNTVFKCSYVMGLIKPVTGRKSLVHIILKNDQSHLFNREIGRVYTEPVSDKNPSRGFFGTCDYITENILNNPSINSGNIRSCSDLAHLMGILFGIAVFGAELYPKDAEYVLSSDDNGVLTVTMLDFGMFGKMDLINQKNLDDYLTMIKFTISEMDIYFPYESVVDNPDSEEPRLFQHLVSGFKQAAEFYIPRKQNEIVQESLRILLEKFLTPSDFSPIMSVIPVTNITKLARDNREFRTTVNTTEKSELVVMSLKPGQEIGSETHRDSDQTTVIVSGAGLAVLNGKKYPVSGNDLILIPAGTKHNIVNTSKREHLKLYTIYSPPE